MANTKPPKELQSWIEAKKRHRLSQMHIQMARELGMNPKSFGKLDNHKQEPWKVPLPRFIEDLYVNYPFLKEGAWKETNKPGLTRLRF